MGMIRFLLNFILFGALFYLIWFFFPDTFNVLVQWIKNIIDFVYTGIMNIYQRITTNVPKKDIEPVKAAFALIFAFLK